MMRKSAGTPFKLKGAPFKSDDLPEGVTTSSEDLGQAVNNDNHLVNVTKNTMTTPDLAGVDNSGSRDTGKTYEETYGPKQKEKYGSFDNYVAAAEKYWEEKGKGKNDGAKKGETKVTYNTTPNPQPGGPGDTTDPFTAAEGRNQFRYGKQSAKRAIKAAKRTMRHDDGNIFSLFSKDGRKKRKEAKQAFKDKKSEILNNADVAASNMSGNANDQLTQGRNAWRSGEKIDYRKEMSKGSKGTSYTQGTENDPKIQYDANGNIIGVSNGTPMKYGRSKSATPFKLNKYKK